MIRFINLRGKVNGSATLDARERTASLKLHLRCSRDELPDLERLSVYLVSQTDTVKTVIDEDLCGTGCIGNARGVIIWDGTTVISAGANGMSERTLKKAQEKLLITIAGRSTSAKTSETFDKDEAESPIAAGDKYINSSLPTSYGRVEDFFASSEAARRIRETAKKLFSASGERIENTSKAEAKAGVPISNPFPHIFRKYAKFCRVNESELCGTAVFRGRRYEVTAVRIFDRNKKKPPHTRAFRAADKRGNPYWIIPKPGLKTYEP